jgi:hypothetical protein
LVGGTEWVRTDLDIGDVLELIDINLDEGHVSGLIRKLLKNRTNHPGERQKRNLPNYRVLVPGGGLYVHVFGISSTLI